MLRVRFYQPYLQNPVTKEWIGEYRPVKWPYPHPYWCSGWTTDRLDADDESGDVSIMIAYADSLDQIKEFWPESYYYDEEEVDHYGFSERFPKPEWFENTTGFPECDYAAEFKARQERVLDVQVGDPIYSSYIGKLPEGIVNVNGVAERAPVLIQDLLKPKAPVDVVPVNNNPWGFKFK